MVSVGQYSFRGLTMGRGTPFLVPGRQGLSDLPDVQRNDMPRLLQVGEWPGDIFPRGRTFTLTGHLDDELSDLSLDQLVVQFLAAMVPGVEAPLTFLLPGVFGGGERITNCRPVKRAVNLDNASHGWLGWAVEFHATDPLVYESVENSAESGLPTSGGGLVFPLDFPLFFGDVSEGGTILAVNSGTFPTPPTIRLDGPFNDPSITLVETDETLELNLGVAVDEWLDIDFRNHTVMLNGTASRFPFVVQHDWWSLPVGTSEVQFRASTQTEALLTMKWRSAYM